MKAFGRLLLALLAAEIVYFVYRWYMTAAELQAKWLLPQFLDWQSKKQAADRLRVQSILKAWGDGKRT